MKFERIMDKKILRAPRVKKIGHTEKTGNENTGFFNAILDSRKKKQCPVHSERKRLFCNLSVDKHKTGYFHISKDSKFIFLTSFFSKQIENEVQEMESNWREKKRKSKDLEFVGDLNSKRWRIHPGEKTK